MRSITFLAALPFLISVSVSALVDRDILKPRNWDLRLLSPSPTCNPNVSNIDISIFHRSGISTRDCAALDSSLYNASSVGSISWKSPGATTYDLCVFEEGDCKESVMDVIKGGWEVCYPFSGWVGWRVVREGDSCV